jgi:hypothetical protein
VRAYSVGLRRVPALVAGYSAMLACKRLSLVLRMRVLVHQPLPPRWLVLALAMDCSLRWR